MFQARTTTLALLLGAIAVAGCAGDTSESETTMTSQPAPAGNENPTTSGNEARQTSPPSPRNSHGYAEMSTHPSCELPGGSEYFLPEINLWRADARPRTTIVCAGGAGSDKPDAGRFLIIRSNAGARESVDQVTVPDVGPVKITKAPLGPHAATRGQTRGDIEFRAHDGSTGTLHLKDDTVTLNR